ncbi:hypothetical protein [Microbacterium sp. 1.5R]|uniref:hypothetical protein n=1 Tax=Microbacterium sp. 1.5R TaxID=1916917 RepID=UPI00119FA62C|nr:hypothetical protein [Microbacterium sp. 1.5R]
MFTFTSQTVWPALANIAIALAVFALVILLVVWIGRRRGSTTIALDTTLTLTSVWVLGSVVGAVIHVVKAFAVDWAEFDGATAVYLDWPDGIPCSMFGDAATTMLTCGSEQLTSFTVGDASLGLRLLAAAAHIAVLLCQTTPVAVLAVICFNTLRGRAFTRTLTRALVGGAIAMLVFGIAADLLSGIAATAGLREALPADSEWYPWGYQVTVTPLPFIGALLLAALAGVFRVGMRLQQERDALQRENETLADDTRGLV